MIVADEYIEEYECFIKNYFKGFERLPSKYEKNKATTAWKEYYFKL